MPATLSAYLTRLIGWSTLPLLLFATWIAYSHFRMLQSETDQQATFIARNFATAIDHHLDARMGALNILAASPLTDNPSEWPRFYARLSSYHENLGGHVIFAEANEPRRMLFNTRVPLGTDLPALPKTKANAAAPRAMATGKPAVGDVFMGPVAKAPLVAIAAPIRRDGRVDHLLIATFDLRHFQERLDLVALPDGWKLKLMDGSGEVVAQSIAGSRTDIAGDVIARQVNMESAPWSVVLEIPRNLYIAPTLATGMALGLGTLVVIVISIAGGMWGTRRLGKAVASLTSLDPANAPEIREISAVRERIRADSQQIASFAATQNASIEQERRRLAREVHDQMGQVFTAIRLIVQSIPKSAIPENQETALQQALDMGIASARKITAELRPPLLDDLGLASALEHLGNEITRPGGQSCHVTLDDSEALNATQSLGLFRITQEALTNILRHAGATRINITGERRGDRYVLRIDDDGTGFETDTVRQGAMGLINMHERARLMEGECTIGRGPQGGTRVEVTLPLDKNGENAGHAISAA